MPEVLAIIPARSGSKSVKDKNIRLMNGKPMLSYSIEHAKHSKLINRILVSTDSPVYKKVALEHGAETPFLRPSGISQDDSLDIQVFEHALQWFDENEGYHPDYCVHLRPTHPVRDPADIDRMITMLIENPELDSVRSVSPVQQVPFKMWTFPDEAAGLMKPLVTCDIPEAYNAPRQKLPQAYMQNACIDVMRTTTVLEKHSMTGEKIAGYRMSYDYDIDTEEDFLRTERFLLLQESLNTGKTLKVCCDIDGVIAAKTPQNDYSKATPLNNNIRILNKLYEKSFHIVLFTARGYTTGIDWKDVTTQQMKDWNVKYHELIFGKPDADIYIDDKFFGLNELSAIL